MRPTPCRFDGLGSPATSSAPPRSAERPAPVRFTEYDGGDHRADADLGEALDGLTRVTVGAQGLERSLDWIAGLAATAVPRADGASVTMLERGHAETVCASEDFVRQVDNIQYELREGPCIVAAAQARTVMSGSLGHDPSWPRFGPRARNLHGVNSAIALPLLMPTGEVMGALNVYARARGVFTSDAAARGEAFAAAAAVVVNNARALMQARRAADQLKAALDSRATIDHATGILLSRQGGTPEEAFAALRRLSQNQNVKLAVVAQGVVDEAVRRAHARRGGA